MREFDLEGVRLANYQARLFELSYEETSYSSKIFIRRFLYSDILKWLDTNDFSNIYDSIYMAINSINEEFKETNFGTVKYSKDALYWLGYILRYISYTKEVSTKLILHLIPVDSFIENYYILHTQSNEYAVESLLEINHLSKEIFDKNYRLKQTMEKSNIYSFLRKS